MGSREQDLVRQLEISQQLAETGAALAELRGTFVAGATAELRHDPDLAKALRARAWLAQEPEMVLRRDLSDVPDDWPPGVVGDEQVSTYVGERVATASALLFGNAQPEPTTESPSVDMLEAYLGT